MDRQEIDFNDFSIKPFQQFDEGWFLLTAGDLPAGQFNAMTISWGSIGLNLEPPDGAGGC